MDIIMPSLVSSKNYVKFEDGFIYSEDERTMSNDVKFSRSSYIMPDVTDVKVVYNNEKPKVVILTFSDNTTEKAVLDDSDNFSLENGISICITKKLLSSKLPGNGTAIYNKIIRHITKLYDDKNKEIKKKVAEEEARKERETSLAEKKRKRKEEKEEADRAKLVHDITDGVISALRIFRELDKASTTVEEGTE